MKNMLNAGLALACLLVAFAACQNEQPAAATVATGTKYQCPMNCEKGKTYDQPGTCPVCNMKLKPVEGSASAAPKLEFFTAFASVPAQLEAGKPAVLSFTPKIRGNESAPVPLDLVHEKKMHLILVSDDLATFDHIHPEYQAGGAYEIKVLGKADPFTNGHGKNETRLGAGGKYWAFADFKPTAGLNTVDKIELNVAGQPAKPVVFSAEKLASSVDGFDLKLSGHAGGISLAAGAPVRFHAAISKAGKPVDPATFENYLGEKAHVVMIETASKAYVHTHPSVSGGELEISTQFSQPGTYRGWLQFQTDGKVHSADFVVKVAEAPAGAAQPAAGGGHSGH